MRRFKSNSIYIFLILCIFITSFQENFVFGASNKDLNTVNFNEKYINKDFSYDNNELEINKTATPLHKDTTQQIQDRTYKVDLNVKAKQQFLNKKEKQDIILILDKSGSMNHSVNNSKVNPFKMLKDSVNNFSKKILDSSKDNTNIELITFSSHYLKIKILYDGYGYYTYFNDPTLGKQGMRIYTDYYGYYGVLVSTGKKVRIYYNLYGKGEYYVHELYANNTDAKVIQPFTNNYNLIKKSLHDEIALGGTDTESALTLANDELNSVKNDGRQKYVILFTDGLPSGVEGEPWSTSNSSEYFKRCIDATKLSYNNLIRNHPNVRFISLGFKSSDSEKYPKLTQNFLSYIQNWNTQINGKNLIFINNEKEIDSVYNTIASRIVQASSISNDAIIRDYIPKDFEIVKGSENPKGAIINVNVNGNEICWKNQNITGINKTFTFNIKAKNTYFGKETIPSNTYADIAYTNLNDNKKKAQVFNIPKVNVPNECILKLKPNITVPYGTKITLKDLIKTLNIKYGPKDGYIYTWSDNHGNSITIDNKEINSLVGNNFDESSKDTGIVMTKNTTFTLEISNKDIPKSKLDLSDSITIKVKSTKEPHITIIKNVVDIQNKKIITDSVFSVEIKNVSNSSLWTADIKEDSPFTITHLSKGTYEIKELISEGYSLENIKINGKIINKNKPVFKIDMDTSDIEIEITNKKLSNTYFHSTKTLENKFITD